MKLFLKSLSYTLAFHGLFMFLIPQLLIYFNLLPLQLPALPLRPVGLTIIFLSITIYLWVIYWLSTHGQGTPAFFDSPQKLVIAGPYRFSRNPMYLAALLLLIGQTIYHFSLLLLGYSGLVFIAFNLFLFHYEEPHLKSKYPQQSADYFRQIPRWL
jgi:protein-S-isoprenylcysteine O-methyltransferase Ste14